MRFLKDLFGKKRTLEPDLDLIVEDIPEVAKEQWSALYITGIETNLSDLQVLFQGTLLFRNGVFENVLVEGNKISVLNAITPGLFTEEKIFGIVVLVNATSFSEYADLLLKELVRIVEKFVQKFPTAILGEKPNQEFSSEEFESWLKKERNKFFFIE